MSTRKSRRTSRRSASQTRLAHSFAITWMPLSRRLMSSQPPASYAGTTIRSLASRYQSNETPNVAEVLTRRDYYRVDWPVRTRRREFGVYTEEVLAIYASFGIGILTNIGNG